MTTRVHRLVFTKLEDPTQVDGCGRDRCIVFRSCALEDLGLTEERVNQICDYPDNSRWQTKLSSLCYHHSGRLHQAVVHGQYLPQARDCTGRGNIYLFQVLVFGSSGDLTRPVPAGRLASLISEWVYPDRSAILNSRVSLKNGTIAPLAVSGDVLKADRQVFLPDLTPSQQKLLMVVLKACRRQDLRIAGEGEDHAFFALLDGVTPYLPPQLLPFFSWDSDYSQGNRKHHPFRLIAWRRIPPVFSEMVVHVDLRSKTYGTETIADSLTAPVGCFEEWLAYCFQNGMAVQPEDVAKAYDSACFLQPETDHPILPAPGTPASFWSANQTAVNRILESGEIGRRPALLVEALWDSVQEARTGHLQKMEEIWQSVLSYRLKQIGFDFPALEGAVGAVIRRSSPWPDCLRHEMSIDDLLAYLEVLAAQGLNQPTSLSLSQWLQAGGAGSLLAYPLLSSCVSSLPPPAPHSKNMITRILSWLTH
jgi:hypothetical protein